MFCAALGLMTGSMMAAPDAYVIAIGDELEFDVLDDNDPPQRFVVGGDGAVQLPFIGGVRVGNATIQQARETITQSYIDKQIFVAPQIELSIASFRPISVLGDVKNPGNFDFQPQMTVEQAVGMAGGPAISTNNEEARVLERRNLEGTLNGLEFELALLAARYARAQAQLKREDSAVWSEVPPQIRAGISREIFEEHRTEEDRIIALEGQDALTRRKLLTDAVAEASMRIDLLTERATVLSDVLEATTAEAVRVKDLAERGLVPRNEVAQKEIAASQSQSQLLQLREQMAAARVQHAELSGRLSQFDTTRERELLTESQTSLSEINRAIARRESIQDRIRLLQQWMQAATGLETDLLLEYQVRRRTGATTENIRIKPFDELLPGDLLVVAVKSPEALDQPG